MSFEAIAQFLQGRVPSKYEKKGKSFRVLLKNMMKKNNHSMFYNYQMEAVLQTQRHLFIAEEDGNTFRGGQRLECDPVLIIAPTGSGKSGIIVMLPYVLESQKVLVLTPSVLISKQLERAFGINKGEESFFQVTGFSRAGRDEALENILETGVILKHPNDIRKRLPNLVIVNAQKFGGNSKLSLQYNDKEMVDDVEAFFRQFDTLIVDEAHHYPAKTWVTIVEEFQKPVEGLQKQIIFITATPYRSVGGKHMPILKDQHQRIAYQIRAKDVEGKTVRRPHFVEKANVSSLANDIKALLKQNTKREPRIPKHQAIVLVSRQDEADTIAMQLNDTVKRTNFAVSIVGNCKKEETQKRMEDFKKGRYEVAVNCMLLNEGYDNNSVSVCVIVRKVGSRILFEQFIGRAMRMKKFSDGGMPDRSLAMILSYKEFKQRKLWNERNELAKEDPENDEEEDDDDDGGIFGKGNEDVDEEDDSDDDDDETEDSSDSY